MTPLVYLGGGAAALFLFWAYHFVRGLMRWS